jgi:predicted transporter
MLSFLLLLDLETLLGTGFAVISNQNFMVAGKSLILIKTAQSMTMPALLLARH